MADDPARDDLEHPGRASRRAFLGGIGAAGTLAVGAGIWWRGDRVTTPPGVGAGAPGHAHQGGAHTAPPQTYPHANRDALQFLNMHQAATVDAVSARIIPGNEDDPGASEATVVYYIDHLLATHAGYPNPAYMEGPFAQPFEGEEPEPEEGVVWVQAEELERYGRQSPLVPRQVYTMGLARLDALSRDRFDGDFGDLEEDQQDELLEAIEDEEDEDVTTIFDEVPAGFFFDMIRTHTIEGFLADPVYGGNRDMVGWRLVGFPGSRRSYSPEDMLNENFDVSPQSLLDLPAFNADHHHTEPGGAPALRQRHPNGPID